MTLSLDAADVEGNAGGREVSQKSSGSPKNLVTKMELHKLMHVRQVAYKIIMSVDVTVNVTPNVYCNVIRLYQVIDRSSSLRPP